VSERPSQKSGSIVWHEGLGREARFAHLGHPGGTIWLTGLSASGKSTIAARLEEVLVARGRHAYRLDGDNIRHGLSNNLGFSAADRAENIRRIGEVARLFADSGSVAIACFISPYREARAMVRHLHDAAALPFLEVFVDTPLAVCEARDPKGLYAKARAGEISDFTGVDAPYETPERPELRLDTTEHDVEACVEACLGLLSERGLV